VRIRNTQLLAAIVSNPRFRGKVRNSPDISKGISELGMCEFESSQISQAVRRLGGLPRKSEKRPQMPAFRAFDFVSGLPNRQWEGANRGKSLATPANIPVLRRLLAETGFDHDCCPREQMRETASADPR
jgi:hypothetical protein